MGENWFNEAVSISNCLSLSKFNDSEKSMTQQAMKISLFFKEIL